MSLMRVRHGTALNLERGDPEISVGIDDCCRGKMALTAACADADITVGEPIEFVRRERGNKRGEPRDWSGERLCELTAFIVGTHHQFTRWEVPALWRLASEVANQHRETHPELLRMVTLLHELQQELPAHMLKEEQMLFPYAAFLEDALERGRPVPTPFFGSVRNPIRLRMEEHDSAGEKLAELRRLSRAYEVPAEACMKYQGLYRRLAAFDADLRRHIHLENDILFPRAIDLESTGKIVSSRCGGGCQDRNRREE